jgi:hypothetical protein
MAAPTRLRSPASFPGGKSNPSTDIEDSSVSQETQSDLVHRFGQQWTGRPERSGSVVQRGSEQLDMRSGGARTFSPLSAAHWRRVRRW